MTKSKRQQNIQKLLELSRSTFAIEDGIGDRSEAKSCSEIMAGSIGTCSIIFPSLDKSTSTTTNND